MERKSSFLELFTCKVLKGWYLFMYVFKVFFFFLVEVTYLKMFVYVQS